MNQKMLTYNGITKPVTAWSEITGLTTSTIHSRIAIGWTPAQVLTNKVASNGSRKTRFNVDPDLLERVSNVKPGHNDAAVKLTEFVAKHRIVTSNEA